MYDVQNKKKFIKYILGCCGAPEQEQEQPEEQPHPPQRLQTHPQLQPSDHGDSYCNQHVEKTENRMDENEQLNENSNNVCDACAFIALQQQRGDDTDSFTPRVRSDKRSITLLLGKVI